MPISTQKKLKTWRERIEQAAYAEGHSHGVRLGYSVGKAQGYEWALRDLTQQTPWRVESLKQMAAWPPVPSTPISSLNPIQAHETLYWSMVWPQ
jgi:hypothetical protein